jgi:glycosyltransferase involved in cell wall biosynthesis
MVTVLCVCASYPPVTAGGYEMLGFDIVEGLRARGHDVHVLAERLRGVPSGPSHVHRVLRRRVVGRWHLLLTGPVLDLVERRRAAAVVRRVRPEVVYLVYGTGVSQAVLADLSRRPSIALVAGPWVDLWLTNTRPPDGWALAAVDAAHHPRRGVARLPLRLAAAATRRVMRRRWTTCAPWRIQYTTQHLEELSTASGVGSTATRVPIGIAVADYPLRPAAPPPDLELRLLFVGRLSPDKGGPVAVRAVGLLRQHGLPCRLTMIGEIGDHHAADVRRLAAELGVGDAVTILPRIPRERLVQEYHRHDVLVLPYVGAEPAGIIPLEAMACGIPVVTTGTGGSHEHTRPGELTAAAEPGDAHSLAAAVEAVVGSPDDTARMAAAAREWVVSRHDVSVMIDVVERDVLAVRDEADAMAATPR